MPNDTDVLLSSAEVAELWGKERSAVERAVKAGQLTPVHRGRGIRGAMLFRKHDAEALVDTVGR